MFPFVRFAKDMLKARRQPPLGLGEIHVSHHICWPWDVDMFLELNNGRTLTVYDLGRFMMAQRGGLIKAIVSNGWTLAMAGATVRYRKRVTMFQRIEMRSRAVGWDDRFMYLEQSMWNSKGECTSHVLYRSATLEKGKSIPPARVVQAMGHDPVSPPLPDWIAAWVEADQQRPWPPMQE